MLSKNKLYIKNGMSKLRQIAEKFDKLEEIEMIVEIFRIIQTGKNVNDISKFPMIDLKEIDRQFSLYGVKDVLEKIFGTVL